jgi:hypothetical protein
MLYLINGENKKTKKKIVILWILLYSLQAEYNFPWEEKKKKE